MRAFTKSSGKETNQPQAPAMPQPYNWMAQAYGQQAYNQPQAYNPYALQR